MILLHLVLLVTIFETWFIRWIHITVIDFAATRQIDYACSENVFLYSQAFAFASFDMFLFWIQDLGRTFPTHPWIDSADGRAALRRILVGYSFRDSRVGYCQVSIDHLLLILPNLDTLLSITRPVPAMFSIDGGDIRSGVLSRQSGQLLCPR